MESLRGKVIIVTGSSSGIGASCAVACSKYGARVVICGRNQTRLDEVAQQCNGAKTNPEGVLSVVGDLSDPQCVSNIIERTVERYGTIDSLVHCAGVGIVKDSENVTVDDMRSLWNLHVIVLFQLVKLSLPYLRSGKGSVLVISSALGVRPMRVNTAYNVTKAAQIEFVRQTSVELHRSTGIRFNALLPAWIRTPVLEHSNMIGAKHLGGLIFGWLDRHHPVGRCGTSEEIGEYVSFLVSDAAKHVTGQAIAIDGGAQTEHYLRPKIPFL